MALLSNNACVIGLFDTGSDVTKASTLFAEQGFGGEDGQGTIHVLEKTRLDSEDPAPKQRTVDSSAARPMTGSMVPAGAPLVAGTAQSDNSEQVREMVVQMLSDRGLNKEEAHFYGARVAHGNSVMLIDIDWEHVSVVRDVLQRANAQSISVT